MAFPCILLQVSNSYLFYFFSQEIGSSLNLTLVYAPYSKKPKEYCSGGFSDKTCAQATQFRVYIKHIPIDYLNYQREELVYERIGLPIRLEKLTDRYIKDILKCIKI